MGRLLAQGRPVVSAGRTVAALLTRGSPPPSRREGASSLVLRVLAEGEEVPGVLRRTAARPPPLVYQPAQLGTGLRQGQSQPARGLLARESPCVVTVENLQFATVICQPPAQALTDYAVRLPRPGWPPGICASGTTGSHGGGRLERSASTERSLRRGSARPCSAGGYTWRGAGRGHATGRASPEVARASTPRARESLSASALPYPPNPGSRKGGLEGPQRPEAQSRAFQSGHRSAKS